jgi:DNA polymerase III alpha subunit
MLSTGKLEQTFYHGGMAAPFAELHCHSDFSFLDGASNADDLVERARELGLSALAVTDHQGLYGAVRFTSAAREAGLHPVVGMEVELVDSAAPDPLGVVVPRRRTSMGRRRVLPPGSVAVRSAVAFGDLDASRTSSETRASPGAALHIPSPGGDSAAVAGQPASLRGERKRVPAHRDARKEDLRGVRGRELGPHLVLLAEDAAGYRSLCRLASGAHLSGTKGVPQFTHELLAQNTEGLIALTGCRHGELSRRLLAGDREGAERAARRLIDLFGGLGGAERSSARLFVELQHHLLPDDDLLVAELARLASKLGLPTLVTNDVHYALPEGRELQDVLVGIRHGMTLDECAHLRRPNGEYQLKSEVELRALPPGLPGADPLVARAWREGIAIAGEVAQRCEVELEFERYRFPGFDVPKGETPYSRLVQLCHDGARVRYHPLTSRVVKQMAHELDVIERTGLAEFFLICHDLMRFCKERGIPAQGRGSAGDSIVAYVLGITRVDPIRHELLFERFINEGRTSYPDVDIDFASSRREEVIQYVYEKYGADHTGMVCNVVTYRARSAVREVGYALGFPRPLVDRVAKALETYDSVMVRRDLESEGGFAEFFQVPGEGVVGAGASVAAGGSLPQAVAAAVATQAANVAAQQSAAHGFVGPMGELNHPRGSRLSIPIEAEHEDGRLVRREDLRMAEGGRPTRTRGGAPIEPPGSAAVRGSAAAAMPSAGAARVSSEPTRIVDLLPRLEARAAAEADAEKLAPWTTLRHGPSDDKGGPGDSTVSVRWLHAEAQRHAEIAALAGRDRAALAGSAAAAHMPSPVSMTSSPGALTGPGRTLDGPFGVVGDPRDAQAEAIHAQDALGRARTEGLEAPRTASAARNRAANHSVDDVIDIDGANDAGDDLLPPATVGGQLIDPESGMFAGPVPTKRLGRGGDRAQGDGADTEDEAPTRRIVASSMGGIELDPIPPKARGSTQGLSPWERWLELCARIDGMPRHLSIHVGGMLITAAPLVDIAPLERATMPGRVVVQYDKRDVETIKLIKLDLLGLRMLSSIDDALRDISVDCGTCVDLDHLPEDIPEVFHMIQAADTVGVFQIESRAQMQTLPRSRPETLDDLVVEVAIIRPGPIQGNAVHPYLRRKQGLEPVTYLHPSLEPALKETLGVILYQEQVMKVAIDVAGFTAAESDGFRRAMGTWRSRKEMEKLHSGFVGGCMTVSGLTAEQAEELFEKVAGFASFGFNKSHAAAFARTAYESAFLKLFYPAQFVTGLINAQPMGFYPVEVLINDAKRHGVPVLPVDVNRSRYRTRTEWAGMPDEPLPEGAGIDRRPEPVRSSACVVPDRETQERYTAPSALGYGIRLGLHLVKGIGEVEGEQIDAEVARGGPFRTLADLVARTELSEAVVGRLIRAGALDSLGAPRREHLWQLREVAAAARGSDGRVSRASGRSLDLRLPPTGAPDLPPPTELERLGDSYAILSLDARNQVVELFRPALDRLGVLQLAALTDRKPGRVKIGGLVVTRQHPMTARGTVFLALEDETGMVNVTLWPKVWAELRGVVRRHALLYVEGELQSEHGVINLIAQKILPLTEVARGAGGPSGAPGVRHMGHAGMRRQG